MRRVLIAVSAGPMLLLALCHPAAAQYSTSPFPNSRYGFQTPSNPGPISPYLNLVRGNNPALGYYLGTLPYLDRLNFQGAFLSGALTGFEGYTPQQSPLDIAPIPAIPQTGHLSAFQAYGSFYNYGQQQHPYYPLNPGQARMLPR